MEQMIQALRESNASFPIVNGLLVECDTCYLVGEEVSTKLVSLVPFSQIHSAARFAMTLSNETRRLMFRDMYRTLNNMTPHLIDALFDPQFTSMRDFQKKDI
jgi:hypothetical protein